MLLFLGWFGFNGGSVLSANPGALGLVFVTTTLAGVAGGAFLQKSGAAKLAASASRNSDEAAGVTARAPRAAVRGEEAAALFAPPSPAPKVAANVPRRLKITPPSFEVSVYRLWANPQTGRLL